MTDRLPVSALYLLSNFIESEYSIEFSKALTVKNYRLPEDPAEYVSYDFFSQVCELAVDKVDDPSFGLKYGHSLVFTHHGPLGAAMMSGKKVSDILTIASQFESIRFPLHLELVKNSEALICFIRFSPYFDAIDRFNSQCCLAGAITLLLEAVGFLHKDIVIDFPHAEPSNISQYKHYLPVKLHFNKPAYAITIPNDYLECSLPKYDEVSKDLFITMCEAVKQRFDQEQSLTAVIEDLLDAYDDYPDLDQLAHTLNLSARTLRTRLQQEDISFRKIVTNHRIKRAKSMLIKPKNTIELIADQLGYSDPANFNRAFKKETGLAPSAYRKAKIQNSDKYN